MTWREFKEMLLFVLLAIAGIFLGADALERLAHPRKPCPRCGKDVREGVSPCGACGTYLIWIARK